MSRRFTVLLASAALAVGGTVASAAPAHAAVPLDATPAQPFPVVCSTGLHALVTLPVGGSFVVGSIAGSTDVLVPYRFDYRWADERGDVLSRSEAQGETGPVPGSAISCTLEPVAYPDGTVFSFTVTAVVRPAR